MGQQSETNPTNNIYIPNAGKLVGKVDSASGTGANKTGGTNGGLGGDA